MMKNIVCAFGLLNLLGCATVMHDLHSLEDSRLKYCNYDGAFNRGMSEAKGGHPLDSNMATIHCKGKEKEEAQNGYREGYTAGLKSK